jgi:peptidoglycan/xylan/chitin deacetylase (PgdA/CDA1 family)
MLIAVNYHYIRPCFEYPFPGIHGITPAQLEAQLKSLSTIGQFVDGRTIQAAIRGTGSIPERAFIITFDDGLREQYEHAWDVLWRLGIPALYFLNTAPIANSTVLTVHKIHLLRASVHPTAFKEMLYRYAHHQDINLSKHIDEEVATSHYKYDSVDAAKLKFLLNFVLTQDQQTQLIDACFEDVFLEQECKISQNLYLDKSRIIEIGNNESIGTHTHGHLPLGLLSAEKIKEQICLSLDHLQDWTGYRPYTLSYPYGSRETATLEVSNIAAECGIDYAFTTERAGNIDLTCPLFLARLNNNDLPGGKAAKWSLAELFETIEAAQWYRPNRLQENKR